MHTNVQKIVKLRNRFILETGHTLLEMVIVCIVFSLFLFAIFATIEVGLKSWQLGATKSDIHQKAEIILNRMVKEINYSNPVSIQIENYGEPGNLNEFICFESPLKDAVFEIDPDNYGVPKWQGHVVYYIKPTEGYWTGGERDIYRLFKPRIPPSIHPEKLEDTYIDIQSYYVEATPSGLIPRPVVKDIYNIDFIRMGDIITIEVEFKKHIRTEASVAFSPGTDASKGTETIILSASVRPDN